MNIGRLDRKIVIETPSQSANTSGEWTQTWSTYHTTFANVQKAGGTETLQADKTTATNKVKFKIRFFYRELQCETGSYRKGMIRNNDDSVPIGNY
jgi:SPP1 family predicted phage head-tail adaptor